MTPKRTVPDYYGGDVNWLKTGDLNDGYVIATEETITKRALEENSVIVHPVGSVVMAMYGATIGKLGILAIPTATNQAASATMPLGGMTAEFIFWYLRSARRYFIDQGTGGAQPNISGEKIKHSLIPLPPLEEQKTISACRA